MEQKWRRRKTKIKGKCLAICDSGWREAELTVFGGKHIYYVFVHICVFVNYSGHSNSPTSFSPVSSIPLEEPRTLSALESAPEGLHQ
jgi:hypothetical protein